MFPWRQGLWESRARVADQQVLGTHGLRDVPVADIFLWHDNPRHKPLKAEAEVIARLCAEEGILALATDIVRNGLNPLERFALVPVEGKRGAGTFIVAEGNRRICALKLLADPDKAPANLKSRFYSLADRWSQVERVAAAVFPTIDAVRTWLERVHSGPQNGAGRKTWDADQKQRFSGGAKNLAALRLLDYGQKVGLISEEDRKRRLTTAQRFLNFDSFQSALGFRVDGADVVRDRPKEDFDALLKMFLDDLVQGKLVTSRMNKGDVEKYANTLSSRSPRGERRIDARAIEKADPPAPPSVSAKSAKPVPPATPKTIHHDEAVAKALATAKHQKLASLYHSITTIEAAKHTPFLTVGAWSLLEILTRCSGSTVAFDAFLSKEKLKMLTGKADVRAETQAIKRLSENGNTTKHDPTSGAFSAPMLVNDMATLSPVILKLAEKLLH